MKRQFSLMVLIAPLIFAACTKQELNSTDGEQQTVVRSAVKTATANTATFVYSGDQNIGVSYDEINGQLFVSFFPPSGVNSTPWFLTVENVTTGSMLAEDRQQSSSGAPILHKMSDGDILLITVRASNGSKYSGSFYDSNTNGGVYAQKSSPFPGNFHWTVSAMDGDSLGVIKVDWTIPNAQAFPIMPDAHDKYYFFYAMYDHTKNESVQFADSASIFDGQKTLGRTYAYFNYDYINVKLYIKGLRMNDGQSYYIPGTTNGEFVNSNNDIQRNTIKEYGTQRPGTVITNGSYYYEPVSIVWQ